MTVKVCFIKIKSSFGWLLKELIAGNYNQDFSLPLAAIF
jgi:hypothetical protein